MIFVFVILGNYEVEYQQVVIEQIVWFIGLVDLQIEILFVIIQVEDLLF